MRISKSFGLFCLIVIGCRIEPHYEDVVLPRGDDVALLKKASYVSHSSSEVVFETHVIVLNSFYEGFDNDYLDASNFGVRGEGGTYIIESFDRYSIEAPATPSSIIFLIDQSGTYEAIDPYNVRSQAIVKFFQDITPPHKFLTGAAALGGSLASQPLELFTTAFSNDWQGNANYIFKLSKRTGGDNAVFDAAAQAVDVFKEQNPNDRKEIVLLVHGNDGGSEMSAEDLASKARNSGVVLNVILFGDQPKPDLFLPLSLETGGLLAACSSDRTMVKVLDELERLMNGETFVYKLRIRFQSLNGVIQPGWSSLHHIEIADHYSDQTFDPVPVTIKIPL